MQAPDFTVTYQGKVVNVFARGVGQYWFTINGSSINTKTYPDIDHARWAAMDHIQAEIYAERDRRELEAKNTLPKLVRAYAEAHGKSTWYVGHFADGTRTVLRKSNNDGYIAVAQIVRGVKSEFVFSAKPSVKLAAWQAKRFIATVRIGLDTAAI